MNRASTTKTPMRIANRNLTPDGPVLIIAEIGVNHDGSLHRALELVTAAKHAGADAIKLQIFRADQLVNGRGVLAAYQQRTTDAESSADLLRRYELPEPHLRRVLAHAHDLGLATIATPFSLADVPTCRALPLDALKIASPDVVNTPLLSAVAATLLPILVSTGAATLSEIDSARRLLSTLGAEHAFLHCISSYPTPDDQAHLCFIPELLKHYGPIVGYSDHAMSVISGALAVAAGATLLERHLTYDSRAPGPDHAASSDPTTFAQYVRLAREATALRGTGPKRVLPIEQDVRKVSRQSLVAARPLRAGERITPAHLTVQRPGTGIPAAQWDATLGCHAARDIPAGTLLTPEMVSTDMIAADMISSAADAQAKPLGDAA